MHPPILLLISADSHTKPLLEQALESRHVTILTAATTEEGLRLLKEQADLALVICDESQGRIASQVILSQARRIDHNLPVIILGTDGSAKAAVEALHRGATDYLAQPVTAKDLQTALHRTHAFAAPEPQAREARSSSFDQIISRSPQMKLLKHLAAEVAQTDATVLITGDSGTGKELFAHGIHAASPRSNGPFVALNCAGIPEQLLESELFGYQRGAFTDAKQAKPGRFQQAEGGTLFLDEIGEMSPSAQAKLLRVLESHEVDPLGDTRSIHVNIRVIAATNEDLPAQIKAGRFRLDLYYRLNVYQLRIPPLRERPEDIEPILISFLETARRDHGCRIKSITPTALNILQTHDWPGNVRELHNVAEGLTITCKDETIQPDHLPASVRDTPPTGSNGEGEKTSLLAFGLSAQEMEKKLLKEALDSAGGNISEASRLLKITRNTLRYRMAKYHL
ncbi:MAG: sigma-54 dependent transcriptional regulator [Nitrospirota bacterium]|nr:sigma-54 dependent transcriptional regulator [Nitrospirota bacterium]MDP2382872.1 sigma-54 dependent transcriptional regulator [Nitrospirota bacterium]MDP3598916.1 sigma-54 dependent transcriptional regulator [Nitrospirota bacterium]